jgi:methyl acetate hydrolase
LLAVLLLVGYSVRSAGMPTVSSHGVAAMDAVLQAAVAKGEIPGVVAAVVNKDEVLYLKAFGKQDVGKNIPMSNETMFRIASMTKPVTSVGTMMQFELGKLKLDDPVGNYLPVYKDRPVIASVNEADGSYTTRPAKGAITVRHLLTHTSGFAYPFSNRTVFNITDKTKKDPRELALLFDPGTKWAYSPATAVLGELNEKLAGKNIEEYYQAAIFKPLGMGDTSYYLPPEKASRLVTISQRRASGLVEDPNPAKYTPGVRGDGGLVSTAADYSKFVQMFLGEGSYKGTRLLKPETVRLMASNQIGNVSIENQATAQPERSADFPVGVGKDKFGLGFQITMTDGTATHERGVGSYTWAGINNTFFWVDPKNGVGVVFLTQVLPFYNATSMDVMKRFERLIYQHLQ